MVPEREEGAPGEAPEGDKEGGGEERGGDGPGSSAPQVPPPSPISSRCPSPLVQYGKKTRDLPNLCNCHRCGLRFPDKGRRERLQPLDSQWRVVLLCKACLGALRSAQVCSYCFAGFVGGDEGFVNCRECSCRVHRSCLPVLRGFLVPSDLDPGLFTCVDCCALPLSPSRKHGKFRGSSTARVCTVSLRNAVKSVKSAGVTDLAAVDTAKETIFGEAVAAKHAADVARGALDLVPAESLPTGAAVPDEALALQLHRAMNGSPRISWNSCPANSDPIIDKKRECLNADAFNEGTEFGNYSNHRGLELCTEGALLETMEIIGAEPLNAISVSEGDFYLNLDFRQEKYQSKEVTLNRKGDATEMPAREEQANCSDKQHQSKEMTIRGKSDATEMSAKEEQANCFDKKNQSKEVTLNGKGGATEMPAREEQANCSDKPHQSKEVTLRANGDATEMSAMEEHANCFDKLVKCTGFQNSVICVSASCPKPGGPTTNTYQQDEKHSMPDRYLKKYCKRPPRTKDRKENKGSTSLPLPVGQ